MDQDSRSFLIGGALFLQSERPATYSSQDYPWFPWFRRGSAGYRDPVRLLEGFLDAMALFLAPPGSVVGCCLDLPMAGRPAYPTDQSAPKHTAPGGTTPATSKKSTNASTGEGYPDQGPPAVTLRITRTGHFTASQDQRQKDLATKIINFLQKGGAFVPNPD